MKHADFEVKTLGVTYTWVLPIVERLPLASVKSLIWFVVSMVVQHMS